MKVNKATGRDVPTPALEAARLSPSGSSRRGSGKGKDCRCLHTRAAGFELESPPTPSSPTPSPNLLPRLSCPSGEPRAQSLLEFKAAGTVPGWELSTFWGKCPHLLPHRYCCDKGKWSPLGEDQFGGDPGLTPLAFHPQARLAVWVLPPHH